MIGNIQKFFSEVFVELKKVSWSSRQEVIDSTWVVLIGCTFLGIFIAVADLILSRLLILIIK